MYVISNYVITGFFLVQFVINLRSLAIKKSHIGQAATAIAIWKMKKTLVEINPKLNFSYLYLFCNAIDL